MNAQEQLNKHITKLKKCNACSLMVPPVVVANPVVSPVMLIGQAPGDKEGPMGKPFAWTAGKTLFKWFSQIGLNEDEFRNKVYMSAVCRCFPGKKSTGGDRVPNEEEIKNCSLWMDKEFAILKPRLLIPVGKLAINLFLPDMKLNESIGNTFTYNKGDFQADVIPLPHPSGASPWHRTEPGISLLNNALKKIKKHSAYQEIIKK